MKSNSCPENTSFEALFAAQSVCTENVCALGGGGGDRGESVFESSLPDPWSGWQARTGRKASAARDNQHRRPLPLEAKAARAHNPLESGCTGEAKALQKALAAAREQQAVDRQATLTGQLVPLRQRAVAVPPTGCPTGPAPKGAVWIGVATVVALLVAFGALAW